MRIVVVGAGAIGGVVGGRLHQHREAHGHDVVLVARGEHGRAMASAGLRIETPDDAVTVDVAVVDRPSRLERGTDDVILLATKSQDTEDASRLVADHLGGDTPIVSLQNGVANERTLLRRFAEVHGVVVMCPAAHRTPGVVQAFSNPTTGILDIGRYPHGSDHVDRGLAAAFTSSGFDTHVVDDIMRWKYGKLMMNLLNAVDAASGIAEELTDLVDRVRTEAATVLAAAGIEYVDREEDRARRGDLLTARPIGDEDRPGGSSWQSLDRRSGRIETDYLNGEIVLLGRLHDVPTPANALLQRVADDLARSGAPPRSVAPADLRAMLD